MSLRLRWPRLEALEDRLAPALLLSVLSSAGTDETGGLGVSLRVSLLADTPLATAVNLGLQVAAAPPSGTPEADTPAVGVTAGVSLLSGVAPVTLSVNADVLQGDSQQDVPNPGGDVGVGVQTPVGGIDGGGSVGAHPGTPTEQPPVTPPTTPGQPPTSGGQTPGSPVAVSGQTFSVVQAGASGQAGQVTITSVVPLPFIVASQSAASAQQSQLLQQSPKQLGFVLGLGTSRQGEEAILGQNETASPVATLEGQGSSQRPQVFDYRVGGGDALEEGELLPPPQVEPSDAPPANAPPPELGLSGADPDSGAAVVPDRQFSDAGEQEAAPLALAGVTAEGGLPSWLVFTVAVSALAVARLATQPSRKQQDESPLLDRGPLW